MKKQRLSYDKSGFYTKEQRQIQNYHSQQPNPSPSSGSLPKGKLIRKQINNQIKLERSLTPQHIKIQPHKSKFKSSQAQDIQSFKLQQSNVHSKFETIKRDIKQNGSQRTRKANKYQLQVNRPIELERKSQSGNGTLKLCEGWTFKGQYISNLFHGFGQLIFKGQVIYQGGFDRGYFHGYGKLQRHELFSYLIDIKHLKQVLSQRKSDKFRDLDQSEWLAYFGQFKKGQAQGFGQIWLKGGSKVCGAWEKGQIRPSMLHINNG